MHAQELFPGLSIPEQRRMFDAMQVGADINLDPTSSIYGIRNNPYIDLGPGLVLTLWLVDVSTPPPHLSLRRWM